MIPLAVAVFVPAVALGQDSSADSTTAPRPCDAPEFRQFDFWLGEWNLTSRMRKSLGSDEWLESSARNSISIALDSCVIVEDFDGYPAAELKGMSVSTYNKRLGRWQQTWVDNQGGYLDFVGGMSNDSMILARETVVNGRPRLQRMVFYDITENSLTWNWEMSTDSGKSWTLLWELKYARSEFE